jgi:hypothetical protein
LRQELPVASAVWERRWANHCGEPQRLITHLLIRLTDRRPDLIDGGSNIVK